MSFKLNTLQNGDRIFGQYLVTEVKPGVTANGRPYATIGLQDATGTIEGKKWDFDIEDEKIFIKGNIVGINADVILYNNALQLKISGGEFVGSENINWALFVPNAPFPLEEMKEKLSLYIESIADEDIKLLVKTFVNENLEDFLSYPAAVRNHHNYVSGLLYHSLTMADLAIEACRIYPSLNRDLVLGGVLIHDIGKTIELSGPNATAFTLEGKMAGHISIGHALFHECASKLGYFPLKKEAELNKAEQKKKEAALLLEHIVLSHHGKTDFGSPLPPVTREALAVSMIDDFDAKMNILDKAYKDVKNGESTLRINSLDERYFYKSVFFNKEEKPAGLSKDAAEEDIRKQLF